MLDTHVDELFEKGDMGISTPHPQFLHQYLLNSSNKGPVSSLYKHLVICKFKTRLHPNLKHWDKPHLKCRIAFSTKLLQKATANLSISKTTAHSHKVTQECILASMRVEKHLIHFPSHPTGIKRNCPVCNGEDSLLHTIVDCALASFLWNIFSIMIADIAMLITVDDRFKVFGLFNKADKNRGYSKAQKVVALSLACLIRSILYAEYYRCNETPNSSAILINLQQEIDI